LREEALRFKDWMTLSPVSDIYRCIVIAIKAIPTVRAVVPANMQLFWYFLATVGAIL
jgi:hypothetical protein